MNLRNLLLPRRHFLRNLGIVPALMPRYGFASASPGTQGPVKGPYARLGVTPLVNAAGTYTTLSACLMSRETQAAVQEASKSHVSIPELQAAAGRRISELLGVEAALVTAGAAAALTLGTAACVAGKDPDRIKRLPDLTGMKDEVIIQKSHRFAYDHAVRAVGVKLVEVEGRDELERRIGSATAMMLFLNFADPKGQVKRAEFVEIARKAGIPSMIDAAADVPPASRLNEYSRLGFDLVCFSGGKGLRGPQCSGLLLGRKDLIEAAFLNGSPHSDSIGRAAKVGKEEIVGLLSAVEQYLKRDHVAEWRDWERQVESILKAAVAVPGVVKSEMFVPEIANQAPHARITWDPARIPMKRKEVALKLREGVPRIEVRPSNEDEPVLEVAVWMLQPGEHRIVGRRVREVLSGRAA